MSQETTLEQLAAELRQPKRDMSDVIAELHISCMMLELHEPGLWWDFELVGMRLRHPAVMGWMEHYSFTQMNDLPPDALIAFSISLKRRLEFLDRALPHAQ
jgi:hypothetical protein